MSRNKIKIAFWAFLAIVHTVILFPPGQLSAAPDLPTQSGEEVILQRSRLAEEATRQAVTLFHKGQLSAAEQLSWKALGFAPNHSKAYSLLAQIYFRLKRDDEALKVLEQAGRYGTNMDMIFYTLADLKADLSLVEKDDLLSKGVYIAQFKDDKKAAFTFCFDDGPKSVYTQAMPIFEEYGYRATMFINPGVIQDKEGDQWRGSWHDWQDAQARGFEIGNHSMTHPRLVSVSDDDLEKEVNGSYDLIEQKMGATPRSFAFPFDISDKRVLQKVTERHFAIREHAYLSNVYPNVFLAVYGGNQFFIKTGSRIVDLAIMKKLWIVAELHEIQAEPLSPIAPREAGYFKTGATAFKPLTTDFLREHLKDIQSRGEVWVDTFNNVYRYFMEKNESKVSWDRVAARSIVFSVNSTLDPKEFDYPLTVVIDTSPDQPVGALAVQSGTEQIFPVRVGEKKLFVNVAPGTQPVIVQWE